MRTSMAETGGVDPVGCFVVHSSVHRVCSLTSSDTSLYEFVYWPTSNLTTVSKKRPESACCRRLQHRVDIQHLVYRFQRQRARLSPLHLNRNTQSRRSHRVCAGIWLQALNRVTAPRCRLWSTSVSAALLPLLPPLTDMCNEDKASMPSAALHCTGSDFH